MLAWTYRYLPSPADETKPLTYTDEQKFIGHFNATPRHTQQVDFFIYEHDLRTREIIRIDTGSADLTNADGLVLHDSRLVVIRNFSRVLTTLRLDAMGAVAGRLPHSVRDVLLSRSDGRARGRVLH